MGGVGVAPFGYTKQGTGCDAKPVINEAEVATVCRTFALILGQGGGPPMGIRPMTELSTAEGVPTPVNSDSTKMRASVSKHAGQAWH